MATRVFAEEELRRLRKFPEINREVLFRFFTLVPADIAFVAPGWGRGPEGQLGLAVASGRSLVAPDVNCPASVSMPGKITSAAADRSAQPWTTTSCTSAPPFGHHTDTFLGPGGTLSMKRFPEGVTSRLTVCGVPK